MWIIFRLSLCKSSQSKYLSSLSQWQKLFSFQSWVRTRRCTLFTVNSNENNLTSRNFGTVTHHRRNAALCVVKCSNILTLCNSSIKFLPERSVSSSTVSTGSGLELNASQSNNSIATSASQINVKFFCIHVNVFVPG